MKKIKYNLFQGFAEDGNAILLPVEMYYTETALETAKSEAYNGKYEIFDDGQPEPEPPAPAPTEDSVWDELDAAYTAGYTEGYTEGVNNAYDQ